ncbi:MAG: chemotaxis protein CheW [Pseudomonadota bacterium]
MDSLAANTDSHAHQKAVAALDAGEALQLISFSVDEQYFGVEITTVREIRAWSDVTPLPNTAPFVRGVINLRGTIVPIIDLRTRFGGPKTDTTPTHVVVVLAIGQKWMGILVDAVSDILTVPHADISPVPDGAEINGEEALLTGIVTHADQMVGLINLPAVVRGATPLN